MYGAGLRRRGGWRVKFKSPTLLFVTFSRAPENKKVLVVVDQLGVSTVCRDAFRPFTRSVAMDDNLVDGQNATHYDGSALA